MPRNNFNGLPASEIARRSHRVEQVREYLRTHPCVDCGEADIVVLECDHMEPGEKEGSVMKMAGKGYSWAKVMKEINKCRVRCANCHRRRHHHLRNEGVHDNHPHYAE